MSTEILTQRIRELGPWFHNLHLPGGVQTAPDHFLGDFPSFKWRQICPFIPEDLSGKRLLDIGCNGGYYSFRLAERGAQVTAIDSSEHYLRQARWAAGVLDMEDRIDFRQASVYQLAGEQETYDIVWFMGVFYHLRYPLLALDIVRHRCSELMIFQTMTMPGEEVFPAAENYSLDERDIMNDHGWPKMAFIEHRVSADPTNWWAPNHAAVEALLRSAGFSEIEKIAPETYLARVRKPPEDHVSDEFRSVIERR